MSHMELHWRVANFVVDTAMRLDRDDLEGWIEQFADDTRYIVMPRDNREQGYAIGLMHCGSKAILQDRISVLRHANKFNPHWDRHILSGTSIVRQEGDTVVAHTNFMAVQTTLGGVSQLFAAGCYEDRIRVGERLQLTERVVLLDTFAVANCLATPL